MNHRIYHQVQLLGKIANPNLWDLTPIPYAWSVYDQNVGNENDIKIYTRDDIIKKIQDVANALPTCRSLELRCNAEIIRIWSQLLSYVSGPEDSKMYVTHVRYEKY